MSNWNRVFQHAENEFFWRMEPKEKGVFHNLKECAKDYCATLVDVKPEYREKFTGKTWFEIFELAGLSEEALALLS